MALEFALRPRFDLERPPSRQKRRRLRLPPLALPIVTYWLAIAGVTHALLENTAGDAPETSAKGATAPGPDNVDAAATATYAGTNPSSLSHDTAGEPAPAPELEPAPNPAPSLHVGATSEPRPDAEPHRDLEPQPDTETELEVEPSAPAGALAARLALASAPKPSIARSERRTPERSLASPPEESPAAARVEAPRGRVRREPSPEDAPAPSIGSCESAVAAANDTLDLRGARGAPDLTRDAFASVLENGAYLARCSVPARTALEICAAVQNGKVVGVTVTTDPRDPALGACVRRAVAALRFPESARLDVTRTRFEPAR